jgi:hypothetical protein
MEEKIDMKGGGRRHERRRKETRKEEERDIKGRRKGT